MPMNFKNYFGSTAVPNFLKTSSTKLIETQLFLSVLDRYARKEQTFITYSF